MKLVEVEQLRTVIILTKFGVDRLIRFCFIGSRIFAFYIHLTNGRYNSLALPCSRFDSVSGGRPWEALGLHYCCIQCGVFFVNVVFGRLVLMHIFVCLPRFVRPGGYDISA